MNKMLAGLVILSLGFMSCATIQTKMGEVAMKVMTKKEKDFSAMAAVGMYQSNMYSPETGVTLGSTVDWVEGQHAVGVQLLKPEGKVGFISLDGTVTVNGKTATSYGGGVYMALFEADELGPKTVRLENSEGTATEFTIEPAPAVRIVRINGSIKSATVNLQEPVELELEYNAQAEGKRVRIAFITNAVGVKGFAYTQSAPIAEKITIPASAFRHKHISGGGPTGKDVTKWDVGVNHLQVSIVEDDRDAAGQPFTYFRRNSTAFDTKEITLEGSTEGRAYIRNKGKIGYDNGTFHYATSASNAWYARPLNTSIDRIGIASLSVNGVLFEEQTESEEKTMDYGDYKVIRTTTTTTTFEFPQLDDVYWNQFLESMYGDMVSMLENTYNASVVDVNEITAHPIYREFYVPEEQNTKTYISKNLRDTKRLYPASAGEILSERNTAMIADADPMPSLLRALDLDALMTISIDYRVAANADDNIVLLPLISFQINGQTQAFDGTSNTWLQGSIEGPGVAFSREEFTNLDALNRIGQKDVLINLIKLAIEDMTSLQSEFGYDEVWKTALNN